MNNFFVSKVQTIRNNLPAPRTDPLDKLKSLMINRTCSFEIHAVHPDQIDKIITNLKNSKSVGLDYIDTFIIKFIKKEIIPAVTHIVNLSITTSKFPTLEICQRKETN